MNRPIAPILLAAGVQLAATVQAFADFAGPTMILGFDDVAIQGERAPYSVPLPGAYGGLLWDEESGLQVANADAYALLFPFKPASGTQAAFNAAAPADVEVRARCGRFDMLGARFRTWGDSDTGTVSFSGWERQVKTHQAGPFIIDRTFRRITLGWRDIDRLVIQAPALYLVDNFRYALRPTAFPCTATAEFAAP